MSIGFQLTPASAAASAVFVEQRNVRRGVGADLTHKVLLVGQYNTGSAPTDFEPVQLLSVADAQSRYGRGSMLAVMADAAFRAGAIGYEVHALPVPDASSGESDGDIVVTGTATASGTLALTIAGVDVGIDVASGDAATAVGDKIEAAVTARPDLPVTASNSAGTVTLTAKFGGAAGDQIRVVLNRSAQDETPAGLTVTVPANLSGGGANPDLSSAFVNLGDTWYTEIVCPYIDDTSITAFETLGAARMDPAVKRPFVTFIGYTDTRTNFLTALDDRNSEFSSFIPVHGSPTTAFEIAAAFTGVWARQHAGALVGRPVFSARIPGVLSAAANDLTYSVRDSGIKAGGSYTINAGSGVLAGDIASTRTQTDAGVATGAYRFVSDYMPGLQLKINDSEITFGSAPFTFATVIDDAAPGGVPNAVRPSTAKAYAIQLVDRWVSLGLTKNRATVVDGIVAEIDATNSGRINLMIPDDFALGLRIMAALIEWDS